MLLLNHILFNGGPDSYRNNITTHFRRETCTNKKRQGTILTVFLRLAEVPFIGAAVLIAKKHLFCTE